MVDGSLTTLLTVIGTVVAAALAAIGTWLASRSQHKGKPEHALIDQLQEQVASATTRISRLEAKQDRQLRRERLRDDYISQLRRHIEDGQPPPPPPWPAALSRHHDYDEE